MQGPYSFVEDGIALRGDRERLDDFDKNHGKFLAVLQLMAESEAALKNHLETVSD
jgi:hypothetical protein